ncbi:MAG: TetR/AcrR family transcriptional regulator [Gemmatimonadota bacterium]|nr:TetR/AcrR family transcriptional regulator [Gemmatimonadota bacterium]
MIVRETETPVTVRTGDRILAAARALLAEGGVERCSMRLVATRAGVTPGAIYRHYRDKDALVDRVVELSFERFEIALLRAIAAQPVGSFARIAAMGDAYIAFAEEHEEEFKVLFNPIVTARKRLADLPGHGGYPILRQCIVEAMDAGTIRSTADPDLVALFLWSRVLGVLTLLMTCDFEGEIAFEGTLDPRGLFEATRDLVVDGLAPR